MKNNATVRKLTTGIVSIVILSVCLCITTAALVYEMVSVEYNLFHTGSVNINLNDGKPVIEEHEFLFEPGMTVEKPFFIKNHSTFDVYYKIYFKDVMGGMADVLDISIRDGETVLFQGTAKELSRANVKAPNDVLKVGERRDLTISFHFPEEAGNSAQNLTLSFDLCAEAVQTKNNPGRLFD